MDSHTAHALLCGYRMERQQVPSGRGARLLQRSMPKLCSPLRLLILLVRDIRLLQPQMFECCLLRLLNPSGREAGLVQ